MNCTYVGDQKYFEDAHAVGGLLIGRKRNGAIEGSHRDFFHCSFGGI